MVASNFEYTITRPYPFRWFTPVVLLGGVILFALFTLLNLVTTGYSMESVVSRSCFRSRLTLTRL